MSAFELNSDGDLTTTINKGTKDPVETRENFGKKAIEDLASQLNKAAHTISDFTNNVSIFLNQTKCICFI